MMVGDGSRTTLACTVLSHPPPATAVVVAGAVAVAGGAVAA
jgi:hypothetical protein